MDCVRIPCLSRSNAYTASRDINSYKTMNMDPLKFDEIASGTGELN